MKFQVLALSTVILSSVSMASGWRCTSEDGYRVILNNKTDATRVPAALIVSHEDYGTVLAAKGGDISKRLVKNGTRYTIEGENDVFTGQIVFYVQYREGKDKPLEKGDSVYGKLILNSEEDEEIKRDLDCRRHLKE